MKNGGTSLRTYGVVLGIAVALMFGLVFPFFRHSALPLWPWVVALVLWLSALIFPSVLRPLQQTMRFVGSRLVSFLSLLLLALFYFLLLVPYSFLLRAGGKISVKKGFDQNATTYRIDSTAGSHTDMEKPF